MFSFFFQAEDGIRDIGVTGVQTCALPILSVGHAASLLFFTFAGWEAVTHLSGEFRDPRRDLRRTAILTLIVVAVLYLGLALAAFLVLGPELATSSAPLTLLLERGVGPAAGPVTAGLAIVLTFGTMTAY